MTRGLSKQQFNIMLMLQTKRHKRRDIGYLSTREVIEEFNPEYGLWLMKCAENPFISNRRESFDFPRFEKTRVSIYRALRALERRGLIVSFFHPTQNARFWAVPERLGELELGWVELDKEEWEYRRWPWVWGAFARSLPKDKNLSKTEILELWGEYRLARVIPDPQS